MKGNEVFEESLCFACLPSIFDSFPENQGRPTILIVTTLLKAIMKDQVTYMYMYIVDNSYKNIYYSVNFVGDISN